jgi:DNA processing protein
LPQLLARVEPAELVAKARTGRQAGGRSLPTAWIHAARTLDDDLDRALSLGDAAGLRWIVPGDTEWPEQLADLDHADPKAGATGTPLGLWLRGSRRLGELAEASVAIVGARDCTAYGAEQAAEIAADAASAGFTVVSGAAFGIDACAHRGALAMLHPTVAILACDAATSYPRAHAALLQRIADEGVIVSEQPPGRVPTKSRFLARNRLIAALTAGTVVVEARQRSGALNTLTWADQLGRITMAVPGPVTSQQSTGTHEAIRDGKAVLVSSGTEVIAALGGMSVAAIPASEAEPSTADTAFDALTSEQARVLDALEWKTPLVVTDVARRAGLTRVRCEQGLQLLGHRGWAVCDGSGRWLLARRADLERRDQTRRVGE